MTNAARSLASASAQRPPSTDLLIAVSQELSELGRTGEMLQDLIAGKVRAGALSGMALLDAQAADLLVQHLTELAKFLRAYAEGLQSDAPDPVGVALNSVLLSALSRRLAPHRNDELDGASSAAGDLEMF
jgi:hypothetical protein